MKIGDGKWAKKQNGERTVRTRKTGVTKRQGWEQGEEEERGDKGRNKGRGKTGRSKNKRDKRNCGREVGTRIKERTG